MKKNFLIVMCLMMALMATAQDLVVCSYCLLYTSDAATTSATPTAVMPRTATAGRSAQCICVSRYSLKTQAYSVARKLRKSR